MTESDKTQAKIWWSIGIVGFISLFFAIAFNQVANKNKPFSEMSIYGKRSYCLKQIKGGIRGAKLLYESDELKQTGQGKITVSAKTRLGESVVKDYYCRGGWFYENEK